jgi:hypothetical protein
MTVSLEMYRYDALTDGSAGVPRNVESRNDGKAAKREVLAFFMSALNIRFPAQHTLQ